MYAQNIYCGYTLELPLVLTSTHNQCFGTKIRRIDIPLAIKIWGMAIKIWGMRGDTFHGHVFMMLNQLAIVKKIMKPIYLFKILDKSTPQGSD